MQNNALRRLIQYIPDALKINHIHIRNPTYLKARNVTLCTIRYEYIICLYPKVCIIFRTDCCSQWLFGSKVVLIFNQVQILTKYGVMCMCKNSALDTQSFKRCNYLIKKKQLN